MIVTTPRRSPLCIADQVEMMLRVPEPAAGVRRKLADLLLLLDRFEEAGEQLDLIAEPDRHPSDVLRRIEVLRALPKAGNRDEVRRILDGFGEEGLDRRQRATFLLERAQLDHEDGFVEQARERCVAALRLDPANGRAINRLMELEPSHGRGDWLLELCEGFVDEGHRNALLLATMTTLLARSGDVASSIGQSEGQVRSVELQPPDGFGSIEELNSGLIEEILGHRSLRYENSRRRSRNTWRVDELHAGRVRIVPMLLDQIATEVEKYASGLDVEQFGRVDHLFVDARPRRAELNAWAVITRESGYEESHLHGSGWVSGAYYVKVPTAAGDGRAGAIEFSWPSESGEGGAVRFETLVVDPEPGLLLLFPSHLHHRTYPHGMDDYRICVSFDVVPLDESGVT